ncbi:glycoside hydrolase family 97 protein [Pedobacter sp. JY14-1]|uniref:glycoside hydrolase family 97 protein n=1 Tax=Pedobacter sp. JY14-1 TaxID=3034151 RepID=UPI0023E2B6C2|nr:glycoside hydrolase family 97 protein [Pedobacter sp. JY14-1]
MKTITPLLLLAALLSLCPAKAQNNVTIKSPDGTISFYFTLTKDRPSYKVNYKGRRVINTSALGLSFKGSGDIAKDLKIIKVESGNFDGPYDLVVGKTKHVVNKYRQAIIQLREEKGLRRLINLVIRAFNDGVAFRYEFPRQNNWAAYTLTEERTEFNVAGKPDIRALLFDNFVNTHEGPYAKMPLSALKPESLVDLPLLIENPDKTYIAITEASLRDYAGMYLTNQGGILTSTLSPLPGQKDIKVKAQLPHRTPWRVIMIADRIGALIESNILTSLNEPSKIKDTSWLKPGKTSFHWWNGDVLPDTTFAPGINFETNKYYIDFCARNNIEYHSVIGYGGVAWYPNNWSSFGQPGTYADVTHSVASLDMKQICDYAKSKGVGIHVWVHWKALYPQLDSAFAQFERWGIKGMMVDFLDRDDQIMVNIQEEILQKAADHHLFIQFHGAYKPTGLSRTYPNEFTREGTYNYEQNKWLPMALTPEHDLDIAFTRLLAGPADYHLGGFNAVPPAKYKPRYVKPMMIGTRCHMLAMYVVMESYLHMVADHPQAYEGQPGFDFLQKIPTTWDETRVLNAEVGQYLTIARRHGNDWYIGTINNSTARDLKIPLKMLSEGKYTAELYSDAEDAAEQPNHLLKAIREVTGKDVLNVSIAAGGGQVIRLIKAPK